MGKHAPQTPVGGFSRHCCAPMQSVRVRQVLPNGAANPGHALSVPMLPLPARPAPPRSPPTPVEPALPLSPPRAALPAELPAEPFPPTPPAAPPVWAPVPAAASPSATVVVRAPPPHATSDSRISPSVPVWVRATGWLPGNARIDGALAARCRCEHVACQLPRLVVCNQELTVGAPARLLLRIPHRGREIAERARDGDSILGD